jgi:hypothetical protein
MTNLKKSMLAMSIMAMPFAASAEMQALGDQDMGSITGQAGVSIELETQVNIGQFIYTDEGSFSISDIAIGGSNLHVDDGDDGELFADIALRDDLGLNSTTDLIDNIVINIDIADDGDALIEVRPTPDPDTGFPRPVDFAVTAGEMRLGSQDGSTSTLVANNLSVRGLINRLDIFVDAGADSDRFQMTQNGLTDEININAIFAIDDLDVDVSMLGIGIRDLRLTGTNYLYNGTSKSVATVGANLEMSIYADQRADGGDALAIDLQDFQADMEIGQVLIGGASIGTIGIDNLHVHNTQMRVYGHD